MTDFLAIQEAEQAVDQGIQLLDEHVPEWRQYIDVGRLNMMSPDYCVLGQIAQRLYEGLRSYGLYQRITEFLSIDRMSAQVEHGFEIDTSTDWSFDDLEAEWRRRLTSR